ncbi:MAG: PAC2 family protein [Acidimicrobiia bacterium]
MSLYSLSSPPPLVDPIMVMGLAGWGDAASAASDAADWIAEDGQPIVQFDADQIFDYRSNRPVLRMSAGELRSLTWPRLEIVHVRPSGRDVLVMVGNEPDYAWMEICEDLTTIASTLGVTKLVTLGAVPTPVRHNLDATVFSTSSDPRLLLVTDEMLMDDIVVPASAGTVFRAAIEESGIPSVGYWAQVPQYVGRPYHPAILALIQKAQDQVGFDVELADVVADAAEQIDRLDDILERREDAREFVEGLDVSVGTTASFPEDLPTADELADEVAEFLREAEGEES